MIIPKETKGDSDIPILVAHKIASGTFYDPTNLSLVRFLEIARWLKKSGYKFVTLSELVEARDELSIAICFDDGYKHLLPILLSLVEAYDFKATILPVAGYLGTYNKWEVFPGKEERHLTVEDIKLLAGLGFEIGSHTLTHPDIVSLSDKKVKEELSASKFILEDITAERVKVISFPFSRVDKRVAALAKEIGYRTGLVLRRSSIVADWIECGYGLYSWDSIGSVKRKLKGDKLERLCLDLVSKCSYFSALMRNFKGDGTKT